MDSLVDKTTTKAITRALDCLPIGSDALDRAYEVALERIEMQKQGFSSLAKRTLIWITNAQRLLTVAEIRHALAVELGEDDLDDNNLNEIEDIISACAGLVIVDQENLRLIHFTTLEYLKRHGPDRFPNAQQMIALSCLTYLQFHTFREEECPGEIQPDAKGAINNEVNYPHDVTLAEASTREKDWSESAEDALIKSEDWLEHSKDANCKNEGIGEEEEKSEEDEDECYSKGGGDDGINECEGLRTLQRRIQGYPFVEYAAYFWASHVEQYTDPGISPTIMDFLSNGYNVSSAFALVLNQDHPHYLEIFLGYMAYPRLWTGMHLAAYLGLDEVVGMLLQAGAEADPKDADNRTPLSWAAEQGHAAVIRLLRMREDVNINTKNKRAQCTALYFAAWKNHDAVVEQLLMRDDIDVNVKTDGKDTPLRVAARNGYGAVVERLLARQDLDANSGDNRLMTPLVHAAYEGHEAIVKLLLRQADANLNRKDGSGRTPLSMSALRGHDSVVKLLLSQKDVEVNSKDEAGMTPLHFATWYGRQEVVRTLLAKVDIELNPRSNNGNTPLSNAAFCGYLDVVKLLLARADVDVDSLDKHGETLLSRAERKSLPWTLPTSR